MLWLVDGTGGKKKREKEEREKSQNEWNKMPSRLASQQNAHEVKCAARARVQSWESRGRGGPRSQWKGQKGEKST